MKINWKQLGTALFIPLAVGGVSSLLTKDNMIMFELIKKPSYAPPQWLFPTAWSVLYVLMGIASYLVCTVDAPHRKKQCALIAYAISLVFNFAWTLIFFNLENYLLAFVWLCALWLTILISIFRFGAVKKASAWLLVPYILWVSFAGVLNYAVYTLN